METYGLAFIPFSTQEDGKLCTFTQRKSGENHGLEGLEGSDIANLATPCFNLLSLPIDNVQSEIDIDVSMCSVIDFPDVEKYKNKVKLSTITYEILTMSTIDFNRYVKENKLTYVDEKECKEARRRHKNRGYSKVSRLKRKNLSKVILL